MNDRMTPAEVAAAADALAVSDKLPPMRSGDVLVELITGLGETMLDLWTLVESLEAERRTICGDILPTVAGHLDAAQWGLEDLAERHGIPLPPTNSPLFPPADAA